MVRNVGVTLLWCDWIGAGDQRCCDGEVSQKRALSRGVLCRSLVRHLVEDHGIVKDLAKGDSSFLV